MIWKHLHRAVAWLPSGLVGVVLVLGAASQGGAVEAGTWLKSIFSSVQHGLQSPRTLWAFLIVVLLYFLTYYWTYRLANQDPRAPLRAIIKKIGAELEIEKQNNIKNKNALFAARNEIALLRQIFSDFYRVTNLRHEGELLESRIGLEVTEIPIPAHINDLINTFIGAVHREHKGRWKFDQEGLHLPYFTGGIGAQLQPISDDRMIVGYRSYILAGVQRLKSVEEQMLAATDPRFEPK